MIQIETTVDLEKLRLAFQRAPAVMRHHVADGLQHVLNGFRKDFWSRTKANLKSRAAIEGGHAGLKTREAWPITVTGDTLDNLQATIGTPSQVAPVLEKGATITGNMALPLRGARTKEGTGRRKKGYASPSEARARGKVLIPIVKNGRTILYEKQKVKGLGVFLIPTFLIVNAVRVAPVLGFFAEWDTEASKAARIRRLGKNLTEGLREVFGADGVTEGVG